MTAPRLPRPAHLLGAFSALLLGCAHQREAHYPLANGSADAVVTSPSSSANTRSGSKDAHAQKSSGKKAGDSQARLDSNDDPDRFDFDHVRD
jgi:hypothetical protein